LIRLLETQEKLQRTINRLEHPRPLAQKRLRIKHVVANSTTPVFEVYQPFTALVCAIEHLAEASVPALADTTMLAT
jgi:hypothetical protein